MDIFNQEPRKLRCVCNDPKSTFPTNEDNALLEVGKIYHMTDSCIYNWYTEIYLEEFPDKCFGSVLFEEVEEYEESGKE